jgi:cyanophycin synthetase
VQLGYGERQRRIWTAETDLTSAIAENLSRDKDLTKQLLAAAGVPVPEGSVVESPDEAWTAAQDIGLPVVVKPTDGNHGRGVFTHLDTRSGVETAYGIAVKEGSGVIVERFVPGNEHRLLVVGDKLVAAARGQVAMVTGDGRSTVSELIETLLNNDPRRGDTEEHPLNPVRLDSAARIELERQGLHADAVPAAGRDVLIQRNGNVAIDCTDEVHPEVAAAAALAARVVGLDIAGIDMVTEDISRPLAEQRGAVVEVNAGPGLLMHLKPAEGQPRPVGQAIVDHLFPPGQPCHLPIVGVTGTRGKTTVAKLVAHLLKIAGLHTGLACSDGLYMGQRCIDGGDAAHWDQARRLLINRMMQAAVIENGSDAILTEGLAYDYCQIGIVTNLSPPACLGRHDVHDIDQVFTVFRTQIDVVLNTGVAVLNAGDPQVADMARLCDGETIFFALDAGHEVIASHVADGKRAVVLKNDGIVLLDGRDEITVAKVADIPMTAGGRTAFQVENVLAAVAAAWALKLAPDLIRTSIETFDIDSSQPLRNR